MVRGTDDVILCLSIVTGLYTAVMVVNNKVDLKLNDG